MKNGFEPVGRRIDSYREQIIDTMCKMIPIKAISPASGGTGELKRAEFLQGVLKSWGVETERYDYKDGTGTLRPNIIARLGSAEKTIWFVGHMDTVSEGDRNLWERDPFTPVVEGDRIYGRGTDDDGNGVVAPMYALKALKESGTRTTYNLGLAIVADEELGSKFGMERLMNEGIFKKNDMFIVTDYGNSNGSMIEIGEKGVLWLKITVTGVQVHASMPERGRNAFRYSVRFLNQLDQLLHSKYPNRNHLFDPDVSTFEMTKHEKNVDSINIVPGSDVFYLDCRVLPEYGLDDVLSTVKSVAAQKEFEDVKIDVEIINRQEPAPITNQDSEIIRLLESAIKEVRNVTPKKIGIGAGTVAMFPRYAGMQAAVYGTFTDLAHQPNEYGTISGMVNDAKVFANLVI